MAIDDALVRELLAKTGRAYAKRSAALPQKQRALTKEPFQAVLDTCDGIPTEGGAMPIEKSSRLAPSSSGAANGLDLCQIAKPSPRHRRRASACLAKRPSRRNYPAPGEFARCNRVRAPVLTRREEDPAPGNFALDRGRPGLRRGCLCLAHPHGADRARAGRGDCTGRPGAVHRPVQARPDRQRRSALG